MLFNSFQFLVFLVIAFSAYWLFFHRNRALRNVFLLAASYVFYGWWDYRFLGLIAFSTVVDFVIGQAIFKSEKTSQRKILLATSLLVNLGLLAYFKYANFFIESFADFSRGVLGLEPNVSSLAIILPVGISFYTFQTLSYTIDIYRKRLNPTNNLVEFAAFVSFFPQLVAGPIERASNLLPQFKEKKSFRYEDGSEGMRLIVWGLFKKTVIADNCAPYVNEIFASYQDQPAAVLLMGAVLFAFQIYGDFSGYSDIAIGTARLFRLSPDDEFQLPLFLSRCGGVLATVAHFIEHLVSRLPLQSPWRKPKEHEENPDECVHHFCGEWFLARSQLDFYRLGRTTCGFHYACGGLWSQPKTFSR